jgi:hypothetical protein
MAYYLPSSVLGSEAAPVPLRHWSWKTRFSAGSAEEDLQNVSPLRIGREPFRLSGRKYSHKKALIFPYLSIC